MPSRNIIKNYVEDGIYHIYNRGVAKQDIFYDNYDYLKYINLLSDALDTPITQTKVADVKGRTFDALAYKVKNFKGNLHLIAYCLMPNHFHLLVRQSERDTIAYFMRSIITRYAAYFNKRYGRVGPLFQGRYKAVLVDNDSYLLHLSRYIHLNPLELNISLTKAYSSYKSYIYKNNYPWLNPSIILDNFNSPVNKEFKKFNSYQNFVEMNSLDSGEIIGELKID